MDIGNRIKNLRKERGLTQRELADKIHKSPQVVSNWERGYTPNITNDDIVSLASALSVGVNDLIEQPSFEVMAADRLPEEVVPIMKLAAELFQDDPAILDLLTKKASNLYGNKAWAESDITDMPEEKKTMIKLAIKAGLEAIEKK